MTRRIAALGVVGSIALGLASRRLPLGVLVWDKSLGDALYAVMVYSLLALARPSLSPRQLAVGAGALCLAIEIFQLTGIPARLPRLAQLALGTTFAWHDVTCYLVGAAVAGAVDALVVRPRVT